MRDVATVAVIGGGPGGYEAALVARQLGADVTLIERDGVGGSAVLTDCVPSKTLVATAGVVAAATEARALGVLVDGREADGSRVSIDFPTLNTRIIELAEAQSVDIGDRLVREGLDPGLALVVAAAVTELRVGRDGDEIGRAHV